MAGSTGAGAGVEMTDFEKAAEAESSKNESGEEDTDEGIKKRQSWYYGEEDDKVWNDYLHTYQKTWVKLIIITTLPSVTIFTIGIFTSMIKGGWYAVAFGSLYEPKGETTMYYMPAILKNHFWGAAFMLPLLIIQVILAGRAVWSPEGSEKRKKIFGWHAMFGPIPAAATMFAVTLGTLALAFCDFQPKRGTETAFFVLVGIAILWVLLRALYYVQKRFTGLHMQYMMYTCYGVSSPGWNRIITIFIRILKGALTDPELKACFYRNAWTAKGYYFTWSFLAGEIWLLGWWLLPFSPVRAPFFKKFSLGFFLLTFQGVLMISCLVDLFIGGADVGKLNCDAQDMHNFSNFELSVKTQGFYSFNQAYGLCAPADPDNIQGSPGAFLHDPTVVQPDGIFPVPDNFEGN